MKKEFTPVQLASLAVLSVVLLYGVAVWGPLVLTGTHSSTPNLAAVSATEVKPPPPVAKPTPPAPPIQYHYIEIMSGCDWSYTGTCVNMRSGPSEKYPIVTRLRTGIVLKVEATTTPDQDGHEWYKIIFDGEIRYPERVKGDWYVATDPESVRAFTDSGDQELTKKTVTISPKLIIVNLTEETLYAYEGDTTVFSEAISTGLDATPTPLGVFTIYRKTPSRYMQGPIPGVSDQAYDLPGVPWNLYFTNDGAVIHGAYWHNSFGRPWSHGCVNLPPQVAKQLYEWADVGTKVIVRR